MEAVAHLKPAFTGFYIPATDNKLRVLGHELPAPEKPYQAGTILKVTAYYEVEAAAALKPFGEGLVYVQTCAPDTGRADPVTIVEVHPPRQETLPGVWEA